MAITLPTGMLRCATIFTTVIVSIPQAARLATVVVATNQCAGTVNVVIAVSLALAALPIVATVAAVLTTPAVHGQLGYVCCVYVDCFWGVANIWVLKVVQLSQVTRFIRFIVTTYDKRVYQGVCCGQSLHSVPCFLIN